MKKTHIAALSIALITVACGGLFLYKNAYVHPLLSNSLEPPEMVEAHYAPHDVVGDLGGVPVTIPVHFANYVEYDGDPGFGKKRTTPLSARTHQSKLSSFGFYVRYPDMVGESTPELREEKRKRNIFKTMWISVGISASSRYYGDGSLDRLAHESVEVPDEILKYRNYEKLPNEQYGLTVYVPVGVDPKTNKPYREHDDAKDVFIYRKEGGKVISYISCSNRPIQSAPCKQWISLEPLMKANVYINYRRGLLPEWKKIQELVTQLMYSFKTSDTTSKN